MMRCRLWVILAIAIAARSASAVPSCPDFPSPPRFPAGAMPASVAAADFNGDGKLDMAVVNLVDGNVTIYLGDGLGGFTHAAGSPIAVGTSPGPIAVGDFNNDGRVDIVVGNQFDTTISVLLGNGNGTFTNAPGSPMNVFGVAFIATGEFNGDGKTDLAIAGSSNAIWILLGNGDGSFTFGTDIFDVDTVTVALAIADFNSDGKQDIAVVKDGADNVSIYLGNGNGTFTEAAGSPIAVGGCPLWISAADLNGDNHPDLVVTNSCDNTLSILLGAGNGMFAISAPIPAGGLSPNTLAIADFDGDGKKDIAAGMCGGSNDIAILRGNGDGTFGLPVSYGMRSRVPWIAAGDFNGDGKPDIAGVDEDTNDVGMLFGLGGGEFRGARTYLAGGDFTDNVATADFNGDGRPDLVVANRGSNNIGILLNNGNGGFGAVTNITVSTTPAWIATADFNGDGKKDLVIVAATNAVDILLGDGAGSFALAPGSPFAAGTGALSYVVTADFNGDGRQDLAIANRETNSLSIFLGNGDGTFTAAAPLATGSAPVALAAGDLNGDGKVDLVAANNSSNNISVFLGNGDGTFAGGTTYAAGSGPISVAIGDISGDGKKDVLVANFGSNDVSILLGDGFGALGAAASYPLGAGAGPTSVKIADFDSDGVPDFATADSTRPNGGTISVVRGLGGGTFASSVEFLGGGGPVELAVADFNGDGKMDIAAANSVTTATVWVLRNLCTLPATHFGVVAPANATAGTAFSFTVTALDQFNNPTPFYSGTVHFTSNDGAATLPANTTLTSGVGTFSATLRTAGNHTLTATDTVTATITGTSNTVAVSAGAATHFTVSAPATATSGNAFSFTVTALDGFNNIATAYSGTVHFTSSDVLATVPANSTLVAGVGTFSATLRTAGPQTISATDTVTSSVTGTSGTIAVAPGAATHFTLSAPASAAAGASFLFTVTARDAANNTATGYAGIVHFSSTDAQATLPANSALTNGIGSFSATLRTAGNQTIAATDTVTASINGTSAAIAVSPGAATHLVVSAPAGAVPGTSFSFTVTAEDAFNNIATAYAGTVHFTSSDPAATLPANATLSGGIGTFSATLNTSGSRTITATDTVTPSVTGTSGAISVGAATATHFTVSAPAAATAGTPFNFTVTALDQFSNIATAYAGTVHFTSTDPAATLPANATLSGGIGTFSATLNTSGSRTITATDTVTPSVTGTSGAISVGAATATHFTVSAPAAATAGTPFNLTVTALDAFNNTATGYTGTVHFTSTDPGATLPADSTLTSGARTFSATFATGGTRTISAIDTVSASITGTSGSIAVTGFPPSITSVSPPLASLIGGQTITIVGTNLAGATSVTFGGTAATITSNTATSIVVTSPAHSAGVVSVVVTTVSGTASSPGFLFTADVPTLSPWTLIALAAALALMGRIAVRQ
jgi:hypothetical protein